MEGLFNNLSLVTYNCRGFKSSMPDVQKIVKCLPDYFSSRDLIAVACRGGGGRTERRPRASKAGGHPKSEITKI